VTSRFMNSLGMKCIAQSDFSTGNMEHITYAIQSGDIQFLFTTPYPDVASVVSSTTPTSSSIFPHFDQKLANKFIIDHGLAVKSVAIQVTDVISAYQSMISNGAISVLPPVTIHDHQSERGFITVAEVELYGDVSLRIINRDHFTGTVLPNFQKVVDESMLKTNMNFGFQRLDHVVGNVWKLSDYVDKIKDFTGFHEFAEFIAEDVGTVDSGLNSVVLANENEYVLFPLNEPTFGTKRKSQIQTYLEYNQGPGVQHLALLTDDIFTILEKMSSVHGGFQFLPPPPSSYYDRLPERLGNRISALSVTQLELVKKLGILVDCDKEGMLLQIFTKPIADRPTIFLEIIQRIGCMETTTQKQKPGCGGFGKGNFRDLFKSIEDHENLLGINKL